MDIIFVVFIFSGERSAKVLLAVTAADVQQQTEERSGKSVRVGGGITASTAQPDGGEVTASTEQPHRLQRASL